MFDVLYKSSSLGSSIRLSIGIVLIGANLRAPITSLGPVLPDIQRDLDLGATSAGLLNSLPLLTFGLLSLVAPVLGRRHGIERVLGASVAAILVGTLIRSAALPSAIWIGTVLLSAGIALGNVLLPALIKRDHPARAASLIGLYAAAMAGMAGISAGLAVPIAAIPGSDWRWSLGLWGLLALVTLLVWAPQLRNKQQNPETGLQTKASTVSPWRHPIGWQVSLFFAFHSLIFYSIVDWFTSYVTSTGVSAESAGLMLLVYQFVAVSANLATASFVRRSRDQMAIGFGCGLLLLIGTSGLLLLPKLSLLWLVVAGLGAGVAMVTSLSLFGLRTHDHHKAGELSGMAQFIGYAGAAAGPLIVGMLHDATGNWNSVFALLIATAVLVMIFAMLAGRNRTL